MYYSNDIEVIRNTLWCQRVCQKNNISENPPRAGRDYSISKINTKLEVNPKLGFIGASCCGGKCGIPVEDDFTV